MIANGSVPIARMIEGAAMLALFYGLMALVMVK